MAADAPKLGSQLDEVKELPEKMLGDIFDHVKKVSKKVVEIASKEATRIDENPD